MLVSLSKLIIHDDIKTLWKLVMLILFSAIAFFYAYLSFQDNDMINFYISLAVGIIFMALMVNNMIKVNKENKKGK